MVADGMGEGPEADRLKYNVIHMGRNKVVGIRGIKEIGRDPSSTRGTRAWNGDGGSELVSRIYHFGSCFLYLDGRQPGLSSQVEVGSCPGSEGGSTS